MKMFYYPGCTLKEKTTNLNDTTLLSTELLGLELVELPEWTCCSATHPLTTQKIMNLVPQARILFNVKMLGENRFTTTCTFCYSTLKRANRLIKDDPLVKKRINAFLQDDKRIPEYNIDEEVYEFEEYNGEVEVVHLLEVLKNDIGFDSITNKIKKELKGLRVAPYYGCKLLRPPKEVKFDDPENPSIMEDFIESLGCEVIDYPFKTECCGSYLSISRPEIAAKSSYKILQSAQRRGADVIILTCPLCYYNLDRKQKEIKSEYPEFKTIPVVFFTQLLAIALEVEEKVLGFNQHYIDPLPLFKEKNIL